MTEKRRFIPLHYKLLLVMLCSLAVALGVYFAANETGSWLIGRFYLSDSAVRARNLSAIEELQSYVQEKNLSSHNTDEIARWTISKRDIYILLYKDQRLALESGWYGIENNKNADEQVLSDQPTVSAYPVCFRDGVFQAVIYDYSDSHLYTLAEIVSIILACVLFASMMLIYNRHITRQIVTISKEVQEIGQGNLHLSMTAKGNDELARLSDSVEAMRLSLLSKTDQERKALEKNSELITAMSHDLRNPLTALLGYLDLAKNRQYRSQEELEQYIGAAYDKAARLKTLSDELFRYALLFGNQELHMNFEEYDAVILFEQLLGEQSAAAQSRGFTVKAATPQQTSVRVRADVLYLKRVFDNLFDNVRKYADPGKPLNIAVFAENGQIHVCICNTVAPQPDKTESSLVGLKTCRRIMEGMGGGFATYEEGKNFTAEVWLPILPENLPQS